MDKLTLARLRAAFRHDFRILLFPIENERKFYKKRFTRVVIPFVVWCVVYAFYYYAQGTNSLRATLLNISHIPLTTAPRWAICGSSIC